MLTSRAILRQKRKYPVRENIARGGNKATLRLDWLFFKLSNLAPVQLNNAKLAGFGLITDVINGYYGALAIIDREMCVVSENGTTKLWTL